MRRRRRIEGAPGEEETDRPPPWPAGRPASPTRHATDGQPRGTRGYGRPSQAALAAARCATRWRCRQSGKAGGAGREGRRERAPSGRGEGRRQGGRQRRPGGRRHAGVSRSRRLRSRRPDIRRNAIEPGKSQLRAAFGLRRWEAKGSDVERGREWSSLNGLSIWCSSSFWMDLKISSCEYLGLSWHNCLTCSQ